MVTLQRRKWVEPCRSSWANCIPGRCSRRSLFRMCILGNPGRRFVASYNLESCRPEPLMLPSNAAWSPGSSIATRLATGISGVKRARTLLVVLGGPNLVEKKWAKH